MVSSSLLHGLQQRPAAEDLSARGILASLGKMDPSLQQAAKSLELHMKADHVKGKLASRPTAHELAKEGVLREDLVGMAPALHGKAMTLEKEMRKDALHKALNKRPELGELQAHNIISPQVSPGGLAPSLASTAVKLEHQMAGAKVAKHLRERPGMGEVEQLMSPSVA